MRKIYLAFLFVLIAPPVSAQSSILSNMPQTPQLITFQPITIPLTSTSSSTLSRPTGNGTSAYDTDVKRQKQAQQQYEKDLIDAREAFNKPTISYTLPSHRNDTGANCYMRAYNELNAMLEGNTPVSLKKAVFLVESAYFSEKLSYETYNKHIKILAALCRLRMQQEHINPNDNASLNDLLFRFMSDTMTITDSKTGKKIIHPPFRYDFDDFYGKEDWTKMFVTKLMATNYGQCHSMPLLYSILAEELGVKAYISTSPSHLYIKYPKNNGFQGVELTNGHLTTDAYVMGSGYIKAEAIRSKIYLDTLSRIQAIALMMQDLGKGYYVKYGFDDFVEQCANTGLRHYPNDAYGMAIKSDYNTVLFQYVVSQFKDMSPAQILAIPQVRKLYENMHAIYKEMDDAGYTQMPEAAYEDWLKSIDREKRKQEYELFLQYRRTHKITLKDGKN